MTKYECTCGHKMVNRKQAIAHNQTYFFDDSHDHIVQKIHWVFRLVDWLPPFNPWYFYSLGALSVLNAMVIMHTDWSFWEGFIESICVGILHGSYFNK